MRIWLRETGSAVPSRVGLLILYTQAEPGAYSWGSSHFPRQRPFIYTVNHYRASPEFIKSRNCVPMTVHCREPAGSGPVVLKIVPATNGCYLMRYRYHHGPFFVRLSFSTPALGTVDMCAIQEGSEAVRTPYSNGFHCEEETGVDVRRVAKHRRALRHVIQIRKTINEENYNTTSAVDLSLNCPWYY